MEYNDFVNEDCHDEMNELSKSLFGKECFEDDAEDNTQTEISSSFVSVESAKNSIRISKDNSDDLIGCNGRLFIAVELVGKALFTNTFIITREQLAKAVCEATQKTNYNCNDKCKTLCDSNGSCPYCLTIAENILKNFNNRI